MHDTINDISSMISLLLLIWMIICFRRIFNKAWRHWWEAIIPIWNVYVYFKIAGRKNWFWALFITPILWFAVSIMFWLIPTIHFASANSEWFETTEETDYNQEWFWLSAWNTNWIWLGWANTNQDWFWLSAWNTDWIWLGWAWNEEWGKGLRGAWSYNSQHNSIYVLKSILNWILWLLALILPLIANILVSFWLAKKFGKWVWFGFWLLLLNPIFIWILAFDGSTYNNDATLNTNSIPTNNL